MYSWSAYMSDQRPTTRKLVSHCFSGQLHRYPRTALKLGVLPGFALGGEVVHRTDLPGVRKGLRLDLD